MADPVARIIIRDDFTAKIADMKQKLQDFGFATQQTTRKAAQEQQALHTTVAATQREFRALMTVTGAASVVGGGFVATMAKINSALADFGRERIQMHYTAQELGTTLHSMENLILKGQALGMTREQAQAGAVGLVSGLRNLYTYGPRSKEFQALVERTAHGTGFRLAQELRQAIETGGMDEGVKAFIRALRNSGPEGQRVLKEIFGTQTIAWMDAIDQRKIRERIGVSTEGFQDYFLALTNVQTALGNVRDRIFIAVMPAFERLFTRLDEWMVSSGAGEKLAKAFGAFADYLEKDVNWEQIRKNLGWLFDQLKMMWNWFKQAIIELDPYVQKMGGWSTLITGVLLTGFAAWILSVGPGFAAIAKVAFMVPIIATGIAVVGGAMTPKSEEGGQKRDTAKEPQDDPAKVATGLGSTGSTRTADPNANKPEKSMAEQLGIGALPDVPFQKYQAGTMRRPGARGQQRRNIGTAQYFVQTTRRQEDLLDDEVKSTTAEIKKLNDAFALETAKTGQIPSLAGLIAGGGSGWSGTPTGGTSGPPGGGSSGSTGPSQVGQGETLPKYATVRLNNPGAATAPAGTQHRKMAETFGSTGGQKLPGGGYTPAFPSPVHGAAFNMWFLTNKNFVGRRVSDIIWEWSGHSRRWAVGFRGDEVVTPENLRDQEFMIKLVRGIAAGEAPGRYPMDQKQWEQAFRWYINGGIPVDAQGKPEQALPRDNRDPAYNPAQDQRVNSPTQIPIDPRSGQQGFASPITGEIWAGLGAARTGHRHQGMDIGAAIGTPVYASLGEGRIVKSEFQRGSAGGIVTVYYPESGITAKYMHMSKVDIVKAGQTVKAGALVGLSGATGNASARAPHLHVEYTDRNGRRLDPAQVHNYGRTNQVGEGLRGRRTYQGVPGSYVPGDKPPLPTADPKKPKPDVVDVGDSSQGTTGPRTSDDDQDRAIRRSFARPKPRIPINVKVRGSRRAKVTADSKGDVQTSVERSFTQNVEE